MYPVPVNATTSIISIQKTYDLQFEVLPDSVESGSSRLHSITFLDFSESLQRRNLAVYKRVSEICSDSCDCS